MRRTILALTVIAFLFPLTASAQQWSAEQQEVWDAEVACLNAGLDDIPARKACIHPEFKGWGVNGAVPVAVNEAELDYYFAHNELKTIRATPLNILVDGDFAVIQLVVHSTSSNDGGPDNSSTVAWTDIMKRDDGKWRWISDHGHRLGDDD